jgi:hypothetical protein
MMDIVVIDVLDVWRILLSRNFPTLLGGTLQMDLTYVIIPMDDDTYVHLSNLTMENNHVEEIDLDLETEETPESLKKYLLEFFLYDLPFTQEEAFNAIE